MATPVSDETEGWLGPSRSRPQECLSTGGGAILPRHKIGKDACDHRPQHRDVFGFVFQYPKEDGKRDCGAIHLRQKRGCLRDCARRVRLMMPLEGYGQAREGYDAHAGRPARHAGSPRRRQWGGEEIYMHNASTAPRWRRPMKRPLSRLVRPQSSRSRPPPISYSMSLGRGIGVKSAKARTRRFVISTSDARLARGARQVRSRHPRWWVSGMP